MWNQVAKITFTSMVLNSAQCEQQTTAMTGYSKCPNPVGMSEQPTITAEEIYKRNKQ